MTVLEEGLLSYLTSYAGLTALVSTRVYDTRIPQGATLPCVTFQRISTPRIHTMDSSGATGELASPRFQIDAWDVTHASVKAIADQVRASLNGKVGSVGAITIRGALVDDEVPEYDTDAQIWRVRSDYIIWQEE